jgi:hypothetical protein
MEELKEKEIYDSYYNRIFNESDDHLLESEN